MQNKIKEYNVFLFSILATVAALLRWQIDQIFIVNVIGCFLLGFFKALAISKRIKFNLGFAFCGSLTTFSGWILYLFELISKGVYFEVFLNIFSIIFVSFVAIYFGNILAIYINKLI
tara:strand:+ start:1061 stop:1411 length:351 start_codon:yes stop_codon:yes gene_type:complete